MPHAELGIWIWLRWLAARGRLLFGDGVAVAVAPPHDSRRLRIDDPGELVGSLVGILLAFVQLLLVATVVILVGVVIPSAAPYAEAVVMAGLPLTAVLWGMSAFLRPALTQIGGGEIRAASLAEDSAFQLLRRRVPAVGATVFWSSSTPSAAGALDRLFARAAAASPTGDRWVRGWRTRWSTGSAGCCWSAWRST